MAVALQPSAGGVGSRARFCGGNRGGARSGSEGSSGVDGELLSCGRALADDGSIPGVRPFGRAIGQTDLVRPKLLPADAGVPGALERRVHAAGAQALSRPHFISTQPLKPAFRRAAGACIEVALGTQPANSLKCPIELQRDVFSVFSLTSCLISRRMQPIPNKFLAAMIAVLPLPGAPRYDGDDRRIVDQALSDLDHYREAGVDAIVLENSHDLPYIKPPLPEQAIRIMEQITLEVRARF